MSRFRTCALVALALAIPFATLVAVDATGAPNVVSLVKKYAKKYAKQFAKPGRRGATGPPGAAGSPGAQGPAGTAAQVTYARTEGAARLNTGTVDAFQIYCPSGTAVSGGFRATPNVVLTTSEQVSDGNGHSGFSLRVQYIGSTPANGWSWTPSVLCAG